MKRGQEVEGKVLRVDFPNKGWVEVAESQSAIEQGADPTRLVAVKNVLPGQWVRLRLKRANRNRSQGNLLSVLEKAPVELSQPKCGHFTECGGCSYQNLSYEAQLALKEEQVRRMMEPVVGQEFDDVFEGIEASPMEEEYRNKMEFSFGDAYKDGPLALGMHKRGSFYDIVTVEDCRIIDGDMRDLLRLSLAYFQEKNMSFHHKLQHQGYLRHLLVRRAQKRGMLLVDLITSSDCIRRDGERLSREEEEKLLEGWKDSLLAHAWEHSMVGILHTRNDSLADVVEDGGTRILYGEAKITEELLGLHFDISPFSFFQTNSLGAERLYEKAREFIRSTSQLGEEGLLGGKVVYDLYSGTGTIAQILAPAAGQVIGVEIVAEAVQAAKVNAKKNELNNCSFIAGDVLKVLDEIEQKPDFIVLDPPRDGIHPKALDKIIDYGVPYMVYISCKPTSLARDLLILQEQGYRVKRMCCVDMFPGTVHVETVVLMSRVKG